MQASEDTAASAGDAQGLQQVKGGPQGPARLYVVHFLCELLKKKEKSSRFHPVFNIGKDGLCTADTYREHSCGPAPLPYTQHAHA